MFSFAETTYQSESHTSLFNRSAALLYSCDVDLAGLPLNIIGQISNSMHPRVGLKKSREISQILKANNNMDAYIFGVTVF